MYSNLKQMQMTFVHLGMKMTQVVSESQNEKRSINLASADSALDLYAISLLARHLDLDTHTLERTTQNIKTKE